MIDSNSDVKIAKRLLNSQGARLHNEPASGLRGTGMNMTDAGAVDTGSNYSGSDQNARGIVWTGKYYIVVNYAANSNKGRFYRLNGDLSQGEFKNGSVTLDHNETDLFYPHGAAWDGRYLAVVGRPTIGSNPTDIHIFDVDNLTSGYATRIAKIDVSSIGSAGAGIGYAEGLYWVKSGSVFYGIEIDFASQTFTTVKQATGQLNASYQFVAYDGSYIYGGYNGSAIYKHNLDGTVVSSVSTGVIPQCTAMTWNGQEFIGIEYNTGNIWAIPVTHKSYSDYQSQGQMIVGYGSNDPLLNEWTYPDVLIGGFPDGNHDDNNGLGGYKFGVIADANNGGNSPTMRKNQVWITGGISGEAYNSFAAWDVGRWGNFGVDARSRLDLYLGDNTADRSHTMTWLYDEDRPRVGINKTDPDTMLEIYNPNAGSSNELYEPALKVSTNVSSVDSYIGISPSQIRYRRETGTSVPMRIQTYVVSGSLGGGDIVFEPNSSTADYTPVEAMRCQKGGNVGINQDSPAYRLDVRGGSAGTVARINAVSSAQAYFQANASSFDIVSGNSSGAAGPLKIRPSGVAVGMHMDASANFGINTDSPQKKLDVKVGANEVVTVGAGQFAAGNYAGIHFGYREDNANYRKSAIVFERTDLTSGNAQGKVHILNGPQSGSGSATLSDAKLTIDEAGNTQFAGEIKPQTLALNDIDGTVGSYWKIYAWNDELQITTRNSNGTYRSAPIRVSYTDSDVIFEGEVTVNSDERIKDNIEQIDSALEKVQAIRGVTYNRTDIGDPEKRHAGVIAQEVEKVLPEVVKDGEDGIKSVAYANMVGLLIEAIKEQQTQIDDLKAEVTRLKGFE
jgi:hypothetical protein